jgi:hypothetical protein
MDTEREVQPAHNHNQGQRHTRKDRHRSAEDCAH